MSIIPHIITAKLESKSVKNSHYQQDSIKIDLYFHSQTAQRDTLYGHIINQAAFIIVLE